MSAPPGSPVANWQIGLGATFTNGNQITGWVDQVGSKVLNQGGTGSNTSYSTSTGLITLPANTCLTGTANFAVSQPLTVALLFKLDAAVANFPYVWSNTVSANDLVWLGSTTLEINSGTTHDYTVTADQVKHTFICVMNGNSSNLYIDAVSQGVVAAGANSLDGHLNIAANSGVTADTIQTEVGSILVYASDMSASAVAIDTWLRAQPQLAPTGLYYAGITGSSGPVYGASYTGGVYQATYTGGLYQGAH